MKKIFFTLRSVKSVYVVFFALFFFFSSYGNVLAQDSTSQEETTADGDTVISKPSVSDKIIGTTFKMLAKSFVRVMDIEKLKRNNIAKIEKMNEGKFEKRRAKIYSFTKDLPPDIRERFAISQDVSRQEVVAQIRMMDKRAIYEIINKMPDQVIAGYFRQEISKGKESLAKSSAVGQIKKFWSKVTHGAYGDAETKDKKKC
ncbi:MAG: hypothetical protein ABIC68_00655 [Candidatus Omnitrophota bacterium]